MVLMPTDMLSGMEANLVTNLFLPLALAVIMFGLGLHLHTADFLRVVQMPRTVLIGLGVQLLVLPPIAFLLCLLFALPPLLAVGLMLLVASPGGATANVFSHLARGDVALNITLTAINSLLILITLPLVVQYSMAYFLGDQALIPASTTARWRSSSRSTCYSSRRRQYQQPSTAC